MSKKQTPAWLRNSIASVHFGKKFDDLDHYQQGELVKSKQVTLSKAGLEKIAEGFNVELILTSEWRILKRIQLKRNIRFWRKEQENG